MSWLSSRWVWLDINNAPESVPKITITSPRRTRTTDEIKIRAVVVGQAQQAILVTVALATAAAANLLGRTIANCLQGSPNEQGLEICYARGKLKVDAAFQGNELIKATTFRTAIRTARQLMDGTVY